MKEYLQIHHNGEITLPPAICRAAKLQEGDGSIRLIPKSAEVRKLVEQSQLKDINWASKQKRRTKR